MEAERSRVLAGVQDQPLVLENVTKIYRSRASRRVAVNQLSIALKRGEVHYAGGPSSAVTFITLCSVLCSVSVWWG